MRTITLCDVFCCRSFLFDHVPQCMWEAQHGLSGMYCGSYAFIQGLVIKHAWADIAEKAYLDVKIAACWYSAVMDTHR